MAMAKRKLAVGRPKVKKLTSMQKMKTKSYDKKRRTAVKQANKAYYRKNRATILKRAGQARARRAHGDVRTTRRASSIK